MVKKCKILLCVVILCIFSLCFSQEKIDINKANLEELKSLPGIGEVIARRIIRYREKYGSFKSIEELKKIKGIGPKKLEKLKDYIEINFSSPNFSINLNKCKIYYYVDEKGIIHYTQFPELVPLKYKKTLKEFTY